MSPPQTRPIAVEVHTSWDPSRVAPGTLPSITSSHGFVAVLQGMKGFIGPTDSGFALIQITSDRASIKGWVPQRNLTRGHEQRSPLPIEIFTSNNRPEPSASAPRTLPGENVSRLRKTLRGIWNGIVENKQRVLDMLPGLAPKAQEVLFGSAAARYADQLYDCLLPQVRAVLEKPDFTVNDLLTLDAVSRHWPIKGASGVYIIIYYDIDSVYIRGTKVIVAVYVGQTIAFQARDSKHKENPGGPKSNHYRMAMKARKRMMIPLLFADYDNLPDNFLDVVEFTIVCLFNSWYPELFIRTNVNLHGAYGLDFEAAGIFSLITQLAIQQSGWVAPQITGLNWDTPIVRNFTKIIKWMSWYDSRKNMWIYRTSRNLIVYSNTTAMANVTFGGARKIALPSELIKMAKFKNGQPVHLVAEISTIQNEPHPFRLVRLPAIGRNSELEKLQYLAVRLEWVDLEDGRWWTAYLSRAKLWQSTSEESETLAMYQLGMAIYMDLTQTRYMSGPEWLRPRPQSDVRQIIYDHLGQKLQVNKTRTQVKTWPRDHTIEENAQRLRSKFPHASHPNLRIGDRPGSMKQSRKCDLCYTERTTSSCDFTPQSGTCKNCKTMNRPCTFTDEPNLIERARQHFGDLEELGIPVNIYREGIGHPRPLQSPPFHPDIEAEEHTQTMVD